MTYNEAYNKIIEAYFKDEIRPFDPDFCFCGTLNRNNNSWCNLYHDSSVVPEYQPMEFVKMESALLTPFIKISNNVERVGDDPGEWSGHVCPSTLGYEDALFAGMCAALEELKAIHKSRGENVDELPKLTKRQLV
jgi:hypothetical protein